MEVDQRTTPLMGEAQQDSGVAPTSVEPPPQADEKAKRAPQEPRPDSREAAQGRVQPSAVDAEAEDERWFEAQMVEAERLRFEAQAERDSARRRAEQRISFTDSIAYHLNTLSHLFVAPKKSTASPQHRSSHPAPPPLSLYSRPPSQRTSAAPTASRVPSEALVESSVGCQRIVDHLVVSGDDLIDLALRYDTSVELIRRHNRRVVFEHLDNVLNEVLHIPVKDSFQLPTPVPSGPVPDSFVTPGIEV